MKDRNLEQDLKHLDSILKDQGISRRDAIKMMGLSSSAFILSGTEAEATIQLKTSNAKGRIVIVGGGLAGMSTAARLVNNLTHPDITVIEPEELSCSYQAGQVFVGAGLWEQRDIVYKRDDFIPTGVKLIKDKAIEFDPDNNTVTTAGGQKVSYDFLVIATGLKLNYGGIKGLEDIGELYSMGNTFEAVSAMNAKGISSVYTADGATQTWKNIKKFVADAKNGKKVKGLFTHPNTPIKYDVGPKEIMYLVNTRLEEAGSTAIANASLHFYTNSDKMFDIKNYHKAVVSQFESRNMKYSYTHNLKEIKDGIAIFDNHKEVKFDFIHITPPMKAPDEIGKSKIGSAKGWVPVNKETLQHVKYKNIFGLGDIVSIPMGKTGGSVRRQYKVVVDNIISAMESKPLISKYDGYTACPLITSIGTVMFAEFNWNSAKTGDGTNATTLKFLNPVQERYIWWLLKFYLLKPMNVYGMLSGKL